MVFALLLAIGATGWLAAREARESFQRVARTNRTIDLVQGVRLGVAAGRSELRNFVLTNDPLALRALRGAADSSAATAAALAGLATEHASDRGRALALEGSLLALDSVQQRTVRARADGEAAAVAMLASPTVSRAGARVTALLDTIERIERNQRRERAVAVDRATSWLLIVVGVALLVAAALVGDAVFDWIHPDERAEALALVNRVSAADAVIDPITQRFVDARGLEVETEVRAAGMLVEGTFAAQLVIRDLRLRRETERKLVYSERRYRMLVDSMEEGVIVYDALRRVQFWNPSALRILGLSEEQLVGVAPYDPQWRSTDAAGRPLAGDEYPSMIAAATGKPATAVMGVERGTGEHVWVKVNAVPLRDDADAVSSVEVTFSDITSLIDTSHRLEESEARFRILAEQSSDLVSLRTLDHHFQYLSPSHAHVLGWTPDDMLGASACDFLHPEDARRLAEHPALADGSRGPVISRFAHKEGHYVTLESVITPIRRADGTTNGYQVSARDVSVRLALEERQRRTEKMEAAERMATRVAHDFNNLLGVVRTSADLLADPSSDDIGRGALLSEITRATERAAALTTQLLTFAQRRHSEPTYTDVAAVMRRSLPLLERLTGPSVAVELEISPDTEGVAVKAEPGQLEEVLSHLIMNARDALPNGGLVRVRARRRVFEEPQAHRHGVIDAGEYVAISVSDNGVGMSDEVSARVFDPFFTTKLDGEGTGLGLASVLGVVEQAGGAVAAQSIEGLGSSFIVYWPVALRAPTWRSPSFTGEFEANAVPDAPAAPDAPKTTEVTADGDGRLLLLVDDEAPLRRVLCTTLTRLGHRVLEAANGPDALALMRRHGDAVRVLITDVRMPGMSGFELVDALLAEGIDTPVLFISGQLDVPIPEHWPTTAVRSFLAKPFASRDLAEMVERLSAVAPTRA